MAEQVDDKSRLQRAAERALFQLASRWAVLFLCATAGPTIVWVGSRALSTMDKVIDQVADLRTDMAVVKTDIRYLRERVKP